MLPGKKNFKLQSGLTLQTGFTLIEMIVTVSMMVILLSLVVTSFGGLRPARNQTILRNNLVSDFRKAQSYSLSSHDIGPGNPASAYSISLTDNVAQYQFIGYNNAASAVQTIISTANFPADVYLSKIQVQNNSGSAMPVNPTSIEIQFKVPFGRALASYTVPPAGPAISLENDDVITFTFSSLANPKITTTLTVNGVTGQIN